MLYSERGGGYMGKVLNNFFWDNGHVLCLMALEWECVFVKTH